MATPDGETEIESRLSIQSPQDWLLFIENEQLYAALCSLKPQDLEFVFVMVRNGYTQREMAEQMGRSQVSVHKRLRRIFRIIKKYF